MGSFIQKTLRQIEPLADEAEVLAISEQSISAEAFGKGDQYISESGSVGHLVTAIQSKRIHRSSIVTNHEEKILSLLDLSSFSKGLAVGERAEFSLNSGPAIPIDQTSKTSFPSRDEACEIVNYYRSRLSKLGPSYDCKPLFTWDRRTYELLNSHGLHGSFAHEVFRSRIRIQNTRTGQVTTIFHKKMEEPSVILNLCEQRLQTAPKAKAPLPLVSGDKSRVLLSPWIVERLCMTLSTLTRLGNKPPENLLRALPKTFELSDVPTLKDGFVSSPFDHEGTLTKEKILFQGPSHVSIISDLAVAARYGGKSSGNGFRRGAFLELPSDLAPYAQVTNLVLKPGSLSLKDVLRAKSKMIILRQMLIPYSQFSSFGGSRQNAFLQGMLMKGGKYVADIAGPNPRHRLLSSPPNTYGSLLDPTAIILREGEMCYSGWFPYILVPRVTW